MSRLFFCLITLLFLSTPIFAENTPESDYQYQLSQYRRNYAEFQIYKKDFLANNTLDNEQKAILAAQNTIASRELTMASFIRILKQSIYNSQVNQPIFIEAQDSLDTLLDYHLEQSQNVTQIQTKKDLAEFTAKSQSQLANNQATIDSIQVVNKLSKLINFVEKIDKQYALLMPQLENKKNLALVASGIEEIEKNRVKINDDIDLVVKQINIIKSSNLATRRKATETANAALSRIQLNERLIINRLIDFDKNYVDH